MIKKYLVLFALSSLVLAAGCSGIESVPVMPDQEQEAVAAISERDGQTLLGVWTIGFDTESLTASVMPSRELDEEYDVTYDIPTPKIFIDSFSSLTNIIRVDITLRNPLSMSGYDVRGIIYTSGGYRLVNPDGWTDLFDKPGGEKANPFRAFAKDTPGRIFAGKSQHTETFEIYLPGGDTDVLFAVSASFPGNCEEPYRLDEFGQDLMFGATTSKAKVWVDVYDWQEDVESVSIECPEIAGVGHFQLEPADGNTWVVELTNSVPAFAGDYEAIITASSGGQEISISEIITVLEQEPTIGLIQNSDEATDGYTLFAPLNSMVTYLINNEGQLVHNWECGITPDLDVVLLENGNLLMTGGMTSGIGGDGGLVQEIDWDGNVVWEYLVDGDHHIRHHDVERLPNGNTLIIAWDKKTEQEALDAGIIPGNLPGFEMWSDSVLEVNHEGELVWEWNAWDHLCSDSGGTANGKPVSNDTSDPRLLDINIPGFGADWLHLNAVDYNPELDQILLSSPTFCEIFIIDHSTADYDNPAAGTEAAAGPAGDIMYRWGNPVNYHAALPSDRKFSWQHDAQWITPGCPGEGEILVFNNGKDRNPQYSSLDIFASPLNPDGTYVQPAPGNPFEPEEQDWIYTANPVTDFFSSYISGATRFPNGNTLVCCGQTGWFFELNPSGEIVWQYINPANKEGPMHQGTSERCPVFRCYRYPPDYPAFDGKDMTPGDPVEMP